uniref:Uncharacterized protein n=1 Tax=Alexandrium monilatum TaxID=311494 RepID=A0A7S4UCZ9_9DINO
MVSLPTGKPPVRTATWQHVQDVGPFRPPYGLGTSEARKLAEEVQRHLSEQGTVDMGALRQVKAFGARFNSLFFQRPKVNDGSWKRWLASLPHLEVVVDPRRAPFHSNCPTSVRWRRTHKVFKARNSGSDGR